MGISQRSPPFPHHTTPLFQAALFPEIRQPETARAASVPPFQAAPTKASSMKPATALFLATALPLATACAAPSAPQTAHSYTATVVSVHDGDTVRTIDQNGAKHRIRLAYIDAPETDQAHGIASRNALRRLLDGQTVRIDVYGTDRYRRQVARITLNGQDINLAQIRNGNAWHYRHYARPNQHPAEYRRYESAETQARQNRTGLWANGNPTAPWDFRRHAVSGSLKTDSLPTHSIP